jgi:chemotaxis protein CheC
MKSPSATQLDALRELANVGCGHAANALSQLVGGRKVELSIPRVLIPKGSEMSELLGGPDAPLVTATLGVEGDLKGNLVFVLPETHAHQLCTLLLNAPSQGKLDDIRRSALAEVSNIVASACLNAIAKLTKLRLLPSPPQVHQDTVQSLLDAPLLEREPGLDVVLEAKFFTPDRPRIDGQLLVIPEPDSLELLLKRMGV